MILSRKPISYPIRAALTFPDMKIVRLSLEPNNDGNDGSRVSAILQNHNDATGKFDIERTSFRVRIEDLGEAALGSKRIRNLLADTDVVVGLVYDVQFFEQELTQAKLRGDDLKPFEKDLQDAKDALAADPGV